MGKKTQNNGQTATALGKISKGIIG